MTATYTAVTEMPMLDDLEAWTHTGVLVAGGRLNQARVRAAVDAVFAAHPELGTVFEPFFTKWVSRPGGGWGWAVEPPCVEVAVEVDNVLARHRGSFDMRTGRLFNVSLLPGDPDRLVLTASRLCVDDEEWQTVLDDVIAACSDFGGELTRAANKAPDRTPDAPRISGLLRLLGNKASARQRRS